MATLSRFRNARVRFAACIAAALAFGLFAAGCAAPWGGTTLGQFSASAPAVADTSVRALLRDSGKTAAKVCTVKGTMVEKCPVSGCWFMLRDATGTIKVDTKDAGFVVAEVPVGTVMQASGTLSVDGNDRHIAASGVRY